MYGLTKDNIFTSYNINWKKLKIQRRKFHLKVEQLNSKQKLRIYKYNC